MEMPLALHHHVLVEDINEVLHTRADKRLVGPQVVYAHALGAGGGLSVFAQDCVTCHTMALAYLSTTI